MTNRINVVVNVVKDGTSLPAGRFVVDDTVTAHGVAEDIRHLIESLQEHYGMRATAKRGRSRGKRGRPKGSKNRPKDAKHQIQKPSKTEQA